MVTRFHSLFIPPANFVCAHTLLAGVYSDIPIVLELNNGKDLIICGLRIPKCTMNQSMMSLFWEFELLTKLYWTMIIVVFFFLCTMGSEYTEKTNRMCRFVRLRKFDLSQGLSVMRLDMRTINSFCLDHRVRKILLNIDQQRIQWRFSLEFWGTTEGIYSLTEILND